jgi:SpoVK/Ycf46/Vps4 family AAA+-type ATPase
MTKRKYNYDDISYPPPPKKKSNISSSSTSLLLDNPSEFRTAKQKKDCKIIIKTFEDCPKVENIKDLIKIGETSKYYKNIDVIMLWNILPYLKELDNMIGMESVKETIFYQVIYYLQEMHTKNRNEEYLHTVIMGSPGCGKTSLARVIGMIYKNLGILSKRGTFVTASREDFIGEHLGATAIKTSNLLNNCIGGVLFIDEVYSMGPGQKDKDSFSKEAIDTICAFLSEHKNDFCCIIAGYETEIKKCFFAVNSGLERRFPWVHKIENYNEENLADIFLKMVNDINWSIDTSVDKKFIIDFFRDNKEYFKNFGGDIETFISKIKMAHSKRIFCLDKENKFIINTEDISTGIKMMKNSKLYKQDTKNIAYDMLYT